MSTATDPKLTCDRIASTLGLDDGSFKRRIIEARQLDAAREIEQAKSLPRHLRQDFDQMLDMLSELTVLNDSEAEPLLTEFSHFYLPQLIEAHQLARSIGLHNSWTRLLIAVAVNINPIFDRYARLAHEGPALFESLVSLYAAPFPEAEALLDRDPSPNVRNITCGYQLLIMARQWVVVLVDLGASLYISNGSLPPSLSSVLLRSRLRFSNEVAKLRYRTLGDSHRRLLDDTFGLYGSLDRLLLGTWPADAVEMSKEEKPWWRCEAKGAGVCEGGCQKIKDGEEMMACGRCKSVRYCSVAHQKAHWKTHKKTCWEPIW